MQAAVIVLGDLGRSPRMQYHALALAVNDIDVDLIGEDGSPLPSRMQHPRIRIHLLRPRRGITGVVGSAFALLSVCWRIRPPDIIVAQTPPAIPTLLIVWIVARLRGSRLVFDWHNLGWTLLAGMTATARPVVLLARTFERSLSKLADAHLAVSEALAQYLRANLSLQAVQVFRDRPGEVFGAAGAAQTRRAELIRAAGLRADAQPVVVISPTSWTKDEALDLVIAAADELERVWHTEGPADGLVIVISGNGAGRGAFEERLRGRSARRVKIITTWVSGDDYPSLIASADAGLSLHRSSSGLDLPMKICDLFGASLPVCALDYGATLRELVDPGGNAVLFADAHGLAMCLNRLFRTWPVASALWQQLKEGAAQASAGPRWIEGWQQEARETILRAS
jgi:beta-1,4-mannosyltransferase